MLKTYIVRLYFKNALHVGAANPGIGIEGTDSSIIHSDTLWAALCNNWAIMGKIGNISFDDFLNSFKNGSPLFKISSAFPFTDTNNYWLPKPLSEPYEFTSLCEDRERKKELFQKEIKRKQLILLQDFIRWSKFVEMEEKNMETMVENIADDLRPHNTLDRLSMESQIYHSGTTYFDNKNAGLYFLLRTNKDEVKKAIEELMNIIKNTAGIGGNRSIGLGAIDKIDKVEEVDNNWNFLNDTSDKNAYVTMSIFHPQSEENYLRSACAYNLILRKGWTGSLSVGQQVKRQTVYMFSEGSVFTEKPYGRLVDLTPKKTPNNEEYPHPIYRYGYAFTLPIKIQQGGCENE